MNFAPTHVVPAHGMPAWEAPDPARPTAGLDPLLPVQVTERRGDWAQVLCANGWSAWVDGRLLIAVPVDPPSGGEVAAADDPGPLLARAEQALAAYRAGRREEGTRIGVVVDGDSVWLYDPQRRRWLYSDGTRLAPYAVDGPPDHAPTRVVTPDAP